MSSDKFLAEFNEAKPAALARVVSIVENHRDGFEEILSALHSRTGRARRIGITGPPGAGKSTITALLVKTYRDAGLRVGVIAVDPTSPFTGGALLGDRVRMESVALDPGVFIRSMATRGSLGGLAAATREVADVLDAFGFDRLLIETVGVGQSELDVARTADSTVLVLVPESGDSIQTLKAGVMEIADIFVVNKADRPGADRLRNDVELMLGLPPMTQLDLSATPMRGCFTDKPDLTPYATVGEILDLVCRLRGEPRQRGREALETAGLGGLAHRSVRELSMGQRRRAVLAAAFVGTHRHVILDEPLEAMDRTARGDLLAWVDRLLASGAAVVVVSHEIEPFVPRASRAFSVRNGRCLDAGPLPSDPTERLALLDRLARGEETLRPSG